MTGIEVLLWIAPRLALWIIASAIPFNYAMNLDTEDDYKNRNKIAFILFVIFFVIAPICFMI